MVRRVGTGLRVEFHVPTGTSRAAAESVAVRAQAAVRAVDPWPTSDDVTVKEG